MALLSTQAVADELEIRRLTAAHTDCVNRREYEEFEGLWAPDGVWVIPGLEDAVGPEGARARLESLCASFEFLVQLLHEGQVWVEGDTGRARWYIVELGRTNEGQGVTYAGVYQDRLVRTAAGWRFARRRFDFLYRGFAEIPGKAYPSPPLED